MAFLMAAACGSEADPSPLDAAADLAVDTRRSDRPGKEAASIAFEREGRVTSFRGDDEIVATCAGGHRGIEAEELGERFALNAFVARPGVYHCDEPGPFILFLFATRGVHAEYGISAVEPGGSCTLRVTSLQPRFAGSFEATLARRSGAGPGEIELRHGRFDVPFPTSPECP